MRSPVIAAACVFTGVLVTVAGGVGVARAAACGDDLGEPKREIESARYAIAFRTMPSPVTVGEHFVVELAVCPKPGAQPVAGVRVDATMPEHRHGMNYRPSVRQVSPGRWRAEGLLFHMPGRWEFVFQAHDGRREDRLTASVEVR